MERVWGCNQSKQPWHSFVCSVAPEDVHQQESIKGNWTSSGATEHTKECHGCFDWLHPKTMSLKEFVTLVL